MTEIAGRIKELAEDLINLEVNTILKENMTARKMPGFFHALLDIAQMYEAELETLTGRKKPQTPHRVFHERFKEIRNNAVRALEKASSEGPDRTRQTDENLVILYRIQRMSDQIKEMLNSICERSKIAEDKLQGDRTDASALQRNDKIMLIPEDLVLVRKAWDLGVEKVVMQTLIQLDGDIITRIKPQFADSQYQILHSLHDRSVATAVELWKDLIETLVDCGKGLFNAILGFAK